MQIKNIGKTSLAFAVGKDEKTGEAVVASIKPGDTASIDVDERDPVVVGNLLAGLIEIVGAPAKPDKGAKSTSDGAA